MSLFTSSQFASVSASGTDWRDTSKSVLEQLESVRTSDQDFNFGFLYISDYLAEDASSILNLFRSVLQIENWVGCVGMGVCGTGTEYIDQPAISAMIGKFSNKDFCVFPAAESDSVETGEKGQTLSSWLGHNDSMLVFVHGSPIAEDEPVRALKELGDMTDGFLIGGFSSARTKHLLLTHDVHEEGLAGVAFSQNVRIATALSQGCAPLGPVHTITRGSEHFIRELDDERAVDVFENDLRSMVKEKIGQDSDRILLKKDMLEDKEIVPEELRHLFKGEVHIAFPISQSDQQDYLVRNIFGMDPDEGSISVSQSVSSGESVMFVHRDDETVEKDLCSMLMKLRERVQKETGCFEPKGALYVSCMARAFSDSGEKQKGEMHLIQDIIGDVPLAGFYAGGEIFNARLYGYTGILTLFL